MSDTKAPAVEPEATLNPVELERDRLRIHVAAMEGVINAVNATLERALGREVCIKATTSESVYILQAQRDEARSSAGQLRGNQKTMKDEIARLRGVIEASENIKELERLRVEVSSLHRQVEGWKKTFDAHEIEIKDAHRARMAAERRADLLEANLAQMQSARDAAQKHETVALRALDEEKAARSVAELRAEGLEKGYLEGGAKINAIKAIHEKGHPKPVADCALCKLIADPLDPKGGKL